MKRFGDIRHEGSGPLTIGDIGIQSTGDNATIHAVPTAVARGASRTSETSPEPGHEAVPPDDDKTRNVFVVYGRDDEVTKPMFDLLLRLRLNPLEWEPLVAATGHTVPFLGDVVAHAPSQAQAALVLLTPDDMVMLHPRLQGGTEAEYERRLSCQPRPNVLLELGMVLMAYPERTLIVEVGGIRPIADLAGRNVIRFDGSATAVGKIVERLKVAGCRVDDRGDGWRDTDPFAGLDAYRRA